LSLACLANDFCITCNNICINFAVGLISSQLFCNIFIVVQCFFRNKESCSCKSCRNIILCFSALCNFHLDTTLELKLRVFFFAIIFIRPLFFSTFANSQNAYQILAIFFFFLFAVLFHQSILFYYFRFIFFFLHFYCLPEFVLPYLCFITTFYIC